MARGIWKGTLGFGLVSIGVELFTAEEPERLDIDLLDRRDMAHVGYQQINKKTGEPVDKSDVVRGIAVAKDRYVLVDAKELKEASPEATQRIDILGFVEADEIPLVYYAKPYYVSPLKGSEKAYRLLVEALRRAERVGVAQLVIHVRQYVAAVYPLDANLVVQLLRYATELRDPVALGPAGRGTPQPTELSMAGQLIKSMEMPWDPTAYRDTYRDEILGLVKRRSAKARPSAKPATGARKETVVLDLVQALKRSLRSGPPVKRAAGARRHHAAVGHRTRSAS